MAVCVCNSQWVCCACMSVCVCVCITWQQPVVVLYLCGGHTQTRTHMRRGMCADNTGGALSNPCVGVFIHTHTHTCKSPQLFPSAAPPVSPSPLRQLPAGGGKEAPFRALARGCCRSIHLVGRATARGGQALFQVQAGASPLGPTEEGAAGAPRRPRRRHPLPPGVSVCVCVFVCRVFVCCVFVCMSVCMCICV